MMKSIFTLIGLLPFFLCQSQNLKPEREAFLLKVQRNPKQFFIQEIPKSAYFVEKNTLQLYALEKVNIEIEIKNDTILSMTSVAQNLHPERTIEIEFCQTVENQVAKPSQLFIKNPFPKNLIFSIIDYDVNETKWTSSAKSAKAKWTSVEKWRTVISSLVLKDIKLE